VAPPPGGGRNVVGVAAPIRFVLDGDPVEVPDDGSSLLEALRDRLHVRSAKDGCSPQGQCGCCTVLVDGQARVACVTPTRRVSGREVTTVAGLEDGARWAAAFTASGASQCGFCTPGIVMRLAGAARRAPLTPAVVDQALLAHLCRCTGWQTIREAALAVADGVLPAPGDRDLLAAAERAAIEGGTLQQVGDQVALGRGGFADDLAPTDALVAVRSSGGEWVVGETLTEVRAAAGKVQGRRTTAALTWRLEVPDGRWDRTLRTTWVEPGYVETDASWCAPGGEPASPLANGGAFGGKVGSSVAAVARRLADEHGRAVRVLYAREDAVRLGPKRPPIAAGVRHDGSGVIRVVRTPGVAEAIRSVAPAVEVEELDVAGPPTSAALRGAGWVEAAVLLSSLADAPDIVRTPAGGEASAVVASDGTVSVRVRAGRPLDHVVLRSYCIGAAHMALGWVRSEGIAVDESGRPADLTIRSFGILRAVDTPPIEVTIEEDSGPSVNGSDAVFAAVAAAAWRAAGHAERWPVR
jgi:aerobic-type carbon monoxide dehydrogenase small subunit (CoxS/CutS family)